MRLSKKLQMYLFMLPKDGQTTKRKHSWEVLAGQKCILHPLIHTFPLESSAQNVEKKKAEPKTPHFQNLNQDIVDSPQDEKCGLKYVIHSQDGPAWSGFNIREPGLRRLLHHYVMAGTFVLRTLTLYLQCEADGGIRLDGSLNSRFQF